MLEEVIRSRTFEKSLLKRGIEKANTEEATDAPESQKSNITQRPKPEMKESPENEE